MANTNHFAEAIRLNERSKVLLDNAAGDVPHEAQRTLAIMAGVAATQAQVHATLALVLGNQR